MAVAMRQNARSWGSVSRAKRTFLGIRFAVIEGARQSNHKQRGCFGFEREIGEHITHQRLVDQKFAEGLAMACMVHCLHQCLAHQCRRADRTIEARMVNHLDDGIHAPALLAQQPSPGAREFHFAGSVRAVTQLVFEPLDMEAVLVTCRSPARQQEAREPVASLG